MLKMNLYEEKLFKDPLFLKEVKKMKLPDNAHLVADPWIYGPLISVRVLHRVKPTQTDSFLSWTRRR